MSQKMIRLGDTVEVHPCAVCGTVIDVQGSKYRVRFDALVAEWFPARRLTILPAPATQQEETP